MANQSINLNLIPDGVKPVAKVSQFDVGRVITFTLYQGAEIYTPPAGTVLEVRGMKADRKIFVYDDTATLSGSTITLTTTMQMTAAAGEALCQFKLTGIGGTEIATLNFWMDVQMDPAAEGDISESEIPSIIAEATEQMHRAEAAANSATASETAAATSESNAATSATAAEASATEAAGSATAAQAAKTGAETAQTAAANSATAAETSAQSAHDWAVGTSAGGTPSDTNNAEYFSNQAEHYAAQFGRALKWQGSILFANLPTTGMENGDLYDITDEFTTDSRFVIGAGHVERAGTDVIWNATLSKWDINTPNPADVLSVAGHTGAVTADQILNAPTVDTTTPTDDDLVEIGATSNGVTSWTKRTLGKLWTYIRGKIPTMTGATSTTPGASGMVPAPTSGDEDKVLKGDGTWGTISTGGGHVIKNSSGTSLPQRANLKFVGATVTDKEGEDATEVSVNSGYIVYPTFAVTNTGHLTAEGGRGVDYAINASGHLIATPQ